jgi:hypothetical protein
MNPERVELLGDAELVREREIDAFALAAVAQGRVVDFNLGFHKWPLKRKSIIPESGGSGKSQKQGGGARFTPGFFG